MEQHDTFGNLQATCTLLFSTKSTIRKPRPIAVFYEKTGGTLRSIYEENIFTEGADSGKIV